MPNMTIKPIKLRPTLPWYLEDDVHENNPFGSFRTPAGILAYIQSELGPEAVAELLAGIIDAGAGRESLMRDVIELAEMNHDDLAEQLFALAEPEHIPARGKDIGEMDFMPPLMKEADEVILKATAAVTKMKVKERLEGISVQERVS
jgi:hypothetical protein